MQATKLVFVVIPFTLFSDLVGKRDIECMGVPSARDGIENYGLEHQAVTSYVPRFLGGLLAAGARILTESARTTIKCVNDYWVSMGSQRLEPDERASTERDIEVFTT